ncbi:MAG: HTH-type transcriptional activator IlvY [Natronospirillum sp.]|uniref:HTH-type transcriptional activator IlvY n=1 Tax=Natronospirillum sp. TaxID=2812955 RepID=UPI0025D1CCE9|nr:HTH-type transcriptional activator IlvY [Natronospirillum sp.]MCH8553203.1 HTH-type transcriptional activator IlvY [Natronospirillum sp.]
MDIRTLRAFMVLAQVLHFGRASERLHVSPSTLSRMIARLEDELGVVLFERDNRTVRLTPDGQNTRLHAERMLQEWDSLQASLEQAPRALRGEIRLYCSVTASYGLLINLLQRFRARHPRVDVVVDTGDAAHAIDKVLADETDVAIAPRPDRLPPTIAFDTFAHSALCFIGPVIDSPVTRMLAGKDTPWAEVPFVVPEHGLARHRLYQWFAQRNERPSVYAQVGGHEAIVSMVALGLGVGVVPELVLTHSPMQDKVQVLPVQPELAPFHIGLCALRRRLQDPIVQAFWQCCPELEPESKEKTDYV